MEAAPAEPPTTQSVDATSVAIGLPEQPLPPVTEEAAAEPPTTQSVDATHEAIGLAEQSLPQVTEEAAAEPPTPQSVDATYEAIGLAPPPEAVRPDVKPVALSLHAVLQLLKLWLVKSIEHHNEANSQHTDLKYFDESLLLATTYDGPLSEGGEREGASASQLFARMIALHCADPNNEHPTGAMHLRPEAMPLLVLLQRVSILFIVSVFLQHVAATPKHLTDFAFAQPCTTTSLPRQLTY